MDKKSVLWCLKKLQIVSVDKLLCDQKWNTLVTLSHHGGVDYFPYNTMPLYNCVPTVWMGVMVRGAHTFAHTVYILAVWKV